MVSLSTPYTFQLQNPCLHLYHSLASIAMKRWGRGGDRPQAASPRLPPLRPPVWPASPRWPRPVCGLGPAESPVSRVPPGRPEHHPSSPGVAHPHRASHRLSIQPSLLCRHPVKGMPLQLQGGITHSRVVGGSGGGRGRTQKPPSGPPACAPQHQTSERCPFPQSPQGVGALSPAASPLPVWLSPITTCSPAASSSTSHGST